MIAHVSMPADDCQHVAKVLAAMLDGGALRFPPGGPSAWTCWSHDNAFQIVVTPRGQVMVPGPQEQEWAHRAATRPEPGCDSHFAMGVQRSAREILTMAHAAGWQARICSRGGFFDLVEVWVESSYLVEVLDPLQMADYRGSMTAENWRRAFGT